MHRAEPLRVLGRMAFAADLGVRELAVFALDPGGLRGIFIRRLSLLGDRLRHARDRQDGTCAHQQHHPDIHPSANLDHILIPHFFGSGCFVFFKASLISNESSI